MVSSETDPKGPAGCQTTFVTEPVRMHLVQTYPRCTFPSFSNLIFCKLGNHLWRVKL